MPLLTTAEAAQRLGVLPRSVTLLCRRGILKGEKRGRDWMIEAEEVERYRTERRSVGRPRITLETSRQETRQWRATTATTLSRPTN
jgi:excisionase family DNA binding protein